MEYPITISTNPEFLDTEFIHNFITNIYWAKGRTMEEVEETIKHSLNFGVYIKNHQVGYARVLTDYVFIAYLLDVFIEEKHRGKGYSKILMEFILKDPSLNKIKVWRLGTDDAHGLYAKFGFVQASQPENLMEKRIII